MLFLSRLFNFAKPTPKDEAIDGMLDARDEARDLLVQVLLTVPLPTPEEVSGRARKILDRLEAEGFASQAAVSS